MITTRGLGPTASLPTFGLGPITLIEVIPHASASGSHSWLSSAVGKCSPLGRASGTHSWISVVVYEGLGRFAGIMLLRNDNDGQLTLTER